MFATLFAAAVLARQNPSPPQVRLPKGWKVAYWGKTQSGHGGLIGPAGGEIAFSDYGGTGKVAEVTTETDRKPLLITAVLGGRRIDVALASTGRLAVSFPSEEKASLAPFDFWRRVTSAREAVETLGIALTRIEAERAAILKKGEASSPPASTLNYPFRSLNYRYPFSDTQLVERNGRFSTTFAPTLERGVSFPTNAVWTERWRILGRTLTVMRTKDGHLAASYEPATGSPNAVFVAGEATPKAAVVAVLAAMTYEAPKGQDYLEKIVSLFHRRLHR